MKNNLSVLGICGAQGALLYPLKKWLIGNVEPRAVFHTPKEEQWKLNFGEIPFTRNYSQFKGERVDIILGSPSCGHSSVFSYSRKKTLGKPREDKALTLFIEAVLEFNPQIFLLENLPKLIDLIPMSEWKEKFANYDLIIHCHSVIEFGNSQKSRKRLIMIGIRKGCNLKKTYFDSVFRVNEPKTVSTLSTMVRKELNFSENKYKKLAMYDYRDKKRRTLTVREVKKLWRTDFKYDFKWPMRTQKMKTLPGVYRNRKEAYPLTLRPSNRQFNPKGIPMGLEEFRLIMGFPKSYLVYFNPENETYWLNKARNALSKGSVYEVGKWFKICLKNALK